MEHASFGLLCSSSCAQYPWVVSLRLLILKRCCSRSRPRCLRSLFPYARRGYSKMPRFHAIVARWLLFSISDVSSTSGFWWKCLAGVWCFLDNCFLKLLRINTSVNIYHNFMMVCSDIVSDFMTIEQDFASRTSNAFTNLWLLLFIKISPLWKHNWKNV